LFAGVVSTAQLEISTAQLEILAAQPEIRVFSAEQAYALTKKLKSWRRRRMGLNL